MNRNKAALFIIICIILTPCYYLNAQKSKGGTPLSLKYQIKLDNPAIDIFDERALKSKEPNPSNPRFAAPIKVNFDTKNAGAWATLPTGERLWQLRLKSKNALGLALVFDNIKLPDGAKLYVYSPDGKQVLGSYDNETLGENEQMLVGITRGQETVIEYTEPKSVSFNGRFKISTVYHAYAQDGLALSGFGDALSCQVNINCAQGSNWQTSKRGVVRILISAQEGLYWCSGSLVNNTNQDGTPYLLSAFHCQDGITPLYNLWTFYFNYESPDCNNPINEPTEQTLQGCTRRAGAQNSDFLLLELTQRPTSAFKPYFNGWNRDSTALPSSSVTIHHPQGDIKKISTENNQATVNDNTVYWADNNISPARSHVRITLDEGVTEPGSSGAPLFDQNKRIVGQLHGSSNQVADPCINNYTLFGWFAKSWEGGGTAQTRLKDWLDPKNSSVRTLDGTELVTAQKGTITGKVTRWDGAALSGVKVVIANDSTTTDANGNFSITNVSLNTALNVTLSKPDVSDNGVDAADILLMRRYLLGSYNFQSSFSVLAGDVDNGGDIDALDILYIRRMILGLIPKLPGEPMWRFVSSQTAARPDFPSVTDPLTLSVTFTGNVSNFNFLAYKIGDVNATSE